MILIEILVAFIMSLVANTPTSWYQVTHDGHLVLACGDDDGAEVPCDAGPIESCE